MKIKYNPDEEGLEAILGSLEVQILEVLWDEAPNWSYPTNKRIHREIVRRGHAIQLSTITTTTRRMALKGILKETEPHNIYIYHPVITRDNLIECVIERVMGSLITSWPEYMETYLEDITFGYPQGNETPQNGWNKAEPSVQSEFALGTEEDFVDKFQQPVFVPVLGGKNGI